MTITGTGYYISCLFIGMDVSKCTPKFFMERATFTLYPRNVKCYPHNSECANCAAGIRYPLAWNIRNASCPRTDRCGALNSSHFPSDALVSTLTMEKLVAGLMRCYEERSEAQQPMGIKMMLFSFWSQIEICE